MLNALLLSVNWSGYEASVARKNTTLVFKILRRHHLLCSYAPIAGVLIDLDMRRPKHKIK